MSTWPPFHPHPLVRGGHAQTLGGFLWPGPLPTYRAQRHIVELDDGDRIVLHEDQPEGWVEGRRVALLVHGLAGCHRSNYMVRIADRLNRRGVRTFRMDLRGCGAGMKLARRPTNSGRGGDIIAVIRHVVATCGDSPLAAVGFSLGGNILLNALIEADDALRKRIASAIVVCPPLDLLACSQNLQSGLARWYDRYFVRRLDRHLRQGEFGPPGVGIWQLKRRPRSIYEFDELVTAPLGGYLNAEDYYQKASPGPRLSAIDTPTCILASDDDPLVASESLIRFPRPAHVELTLVRGGGHLGFVGVAKGDPDGRWLDWRVVDWVMQVVEPTARGG